MDGAWALYEAWVKIQIGDADTALVYGYGKSSPGDLRRVLTRQLDPYYDGAAVARLGRLAALQARPRSTPASTTEADMAEVAARSRPQRAGQPQRPAGVRRPSRRRCSAERLPRRPAAPARLPPDHRRCGVAVVLAAGDVARELRERPAWIRGIDHRIEPTTSACATSPSAPSTRIAAEKAGVADGPIDVAELHAPFTPPGADPARRARPRRRRRRQPVGRAAGRQPDDGRRPDPHRRGRQPHHVRRGVDRGVGPRHRGHVPATEPGRVLEGEG